MWSKLVQRDADLLCLTQIWDVTNGRLVVSGVHNKMAPKMPSPSPKSILNLLHILHILHFLHFLNLFCQVGAFARGICP